MSQYFNFFPKLDYDISGKLPIQTTRVVDIFMRQQLSNKLKTEAVVYYPYSIQDGERPDILAYNYYGDVKFTWIIFFANDIIDPYFQWPLHSNEFRDYIIKKYGSVTKAKDTVHCYQQLIRDETSTNYSGVTYATDKIYYKVDYTTYQALNGNERLLVSKFDYETNLNDQKRSIQLIEDTYVVGIFNEARKALT
jgi:hypothetical protein